MPSSSGVAISIPAPVAFARRRRRGMRCPRSSNLGYRRPEAQAAVARVVERLGEDAALDAIIRESLRELASRAGT